MIIKERDALERLGSPLNLMNRNGSGGPRSRAMSLFIGKKEDKKEVSPPSLRPEFNSFKNEEIETQSSQVVHEAEVLEAEENQVKTDDILDNANNKIQLATAHDKALGVLNKALAHLDANMDEVHASKLPAVISSVSKVVEGIRKERNEAGRSNKGNEVHMHFYTPEQRKIEHYEIVEVG